MKKHISIIDFGAGNLHSVCKAFGFVGANIEITKDSNLIEKSDAVVFPGVGAFGAVMDSVKKNNLEEIIIKSAKSLKPFLGICMGMQVLFESGEENPNVKGLGVFKGKVVRFKKAKKVPHIGWNDVTRSVIARSPERATKQSDAFRHRPERKRGISLAQIDPSSFHSSGQHSVLDCFVGLCPPRNDMGQFYFVHSYYVVPEDKNIIFAETEYDGEKFTSVIKKDNLLAVQFHPEKSGDAGLSLLEKFVKIV